MSTGYEVLLATAEVQGAISAERDGVSGAVLRRTHLRRAQVPALEDDYVQQ